MTADTSDADVILNRINISLARSQKILSSWLPAKLATEIEDTTKVQNEDDDEDFKTMTEDGGVGTVATPDELELPDGAFQRKTLSSNDQLLEQLLGKKAAQQRKEKDAGGSMSISKHSDPKSMASRPKQKMQDVESDDEEEGGRAAAFKSRKNIGKNMDEHRTEADDLGKESMDIERSGRFLSLSVDVEPSTSEKPAKKRNVSYLDELLSQKANKSSKKKKN